MHRLIAGSVLLFWGVMFGGLAHLSLSGMLNGAAANAVDFQLIFAKTGVLQFMPVLLMVVAALFGWALLALSVSDHDAFREIEANAYAAAIFMMGACAILAFVNFGLAASIPAVLVASLATSAAASRFLTVDVTTELSRDQSQEKARRMALGAAHNSLLSRVSGRPIPNQNSLRDNVTAFPTKPNNGGSR
jgi:hypothetical protein